MILGPEIWWQERGKTVGQLVKTKRHRGPSQRQCVDRISVKGWPRKRCRWLLADKSYDAEQLRQYCDRYRMRPVIPLGTMKRKPRPGLPRLFDRPKYRQCNIIERMFGWLKESRSIGTRYDKLARCFAAMVTLACTLRCLCKYLSYRT